MPTGAQFGIGFVDPSNPITIAAIATRIGRTWPTSRWARRRRLRQRGATAIASNWRVSGILNARSGPWMTILSGRDNAFNGMANQRVDQVSDDVYGERR
jgi:hypothetical protein